MANSKLSEVEERVHTPGSVVFLNALPINAFRNMEKATLSIVRLGPLNDPEVQSLVNRVKTYKDVISYIGHQPTANVVGVPMNKGFYTVKPGDKGLVFVLNKPLRGPGDVDVTPADLDVYYFEVS